jgi:uncharacterized SAM-binding protein YcdF (DUF218 family)
MTARQRSRRLAFGLLVSVVVSTALGVWIVREVGGWLVTSDPLEPAWAVVVLAGHMPVRAMEAALIYREGWAREVWITGTAVEPEEQALRNLRISVFKEDYYSRKVLESLGIPPEAIRVLDSGARNTLQEVHRIAEELRRVGRERVIVVTSKGNSRRVKATWRRRIGEDLSAIVRYARDDPYDGDRWWRRTKDTLVVSREVFGLINVWAGFPVELDVTPPTPPK